MRGVGHRIGFSPTVFGVMTCFPTLEASPFPHAFCLFLGGKFLEVNRVNFHSVRITRGSRGWSTLDSEAWVARAPS